MEQQEQDQTEQASSVLRRKARAGQAEHQARAMTLPKALRISLAKVADDLFDMAMAVIGVRTQSCDEAELEDLFDDKGLLLLLEGPMRRRAAAVFDTALVGGLIQQQTMGKVQPQQGEEERKLTATDAAICAPFLDALLARAAKLPEDPKLRQLIEGFQFGAQSEEPRLLLMALDEPEYEVFHLTVDMAKGARQGNIMLCVPASAPEHAVPAKAKNTPDGEGPSEEQPPKMERTVLGLHVDLNVALSRLRLPLSTVQGLKPDDVLDLNVSSFEQCIVQTREGRRLSRGTLGQIDGVRALQLEHEVSPFNAPRRRASDRADLELPVVSGDGTGTRSGADLMALPDAGLPVMGDMLGEPAMADLPQIGDLPDMGALPDLPDMGSLPDLPDMGSLPDLAAPGELPGLPDLPDMSDLPGFDDDDGAPEMTIT